MVATTKDLPSAEAQGILSYMDQPHTICCLNPCHFMSSGPACLWEALSCIAFIQQHLQRTLMYQVQEQEIKQEIKLHKQHISFGRSPGTAP